MKRSSTFALAVLILAGGIAGAVIFVKTRPTAERKKPPRMTPVVECQALATGTQQVLVDAMGTVLPARQVQLKAQVTGKIISTDPAWIEGGRFVKDATIITLEATDYEIALQQAQAELAQARSDLALESGRQDVARREWALLGQEGEKRDRDLALRVPQQQAAEARVKVAEARVEAAQLALSRTRIRAPFNGLVTSRQMNEGDLATPQAALGTVVDQDEYHVRVSVPVDELKWIVLPKANTPGSSVVVKLPGGGERKGEVIRLLGDLEPMGRMARLLVSVPDPAKGRDPLLLGSFVQVQIAGTTVADACRISRAHYHEGGQVWLMTPQQTLRIVTAEPVWSTRADVVLKLTVGPGEQLVTSDLVAAIDGMDLRLAGSPDGQKPGQDSVKGKKPERK